MNLKKVFVTVFQKDRLQAKSIFKKEYNAIFFMNICRHCPIMNGPHSKNFHIDLQLNILLEICCQLLQQKLYIKFSKKNTIKVDIAMCLLLELPMQL
jgi:hypothetical protein